MLFTRLLGGAYTLELRMVTNLPNDVRQSLKDARFQIRVSVSSIPSAVQLSFAKARGEGAFAMAEPDATWQGTDIIRKPQLPRRRLRKVALSESFCILFYAGGPGVGYKIPGAPK